MFYVPIWSINSRLKILGNYSIQHRSRQKSRLEKLFRLCLTSEAGKYSLLSYHGQLNIFPLVRRAYDESFFIFIFLLVNWNLFVEVPDLRDEAWCGLVCFLQYLLLFLKELEKLTFEAVCRPEFVWVAPFGQASGKYFYTWLLFYFCFLSDRRIEKDKMSLWRSGLQLRAWVMDI